MTQTTIQESFPIPAYSPLYVPISQADRDALRNEAIRLVDASFGKGYSARSPTVVDSMIELLVHEKFSKGDLK